MDIAHYSSFETLDIRVGTIVEAHIFEGVKNPAFKLSIDFGEKLGRLQSSAQLTEIYTKEKLINRQILAVVNFPPKQIANFMSQCLVLGVYTKEGVVLLSTERPCENGDKLG